MKQKHLTLEEREAIEDLLKDNFNFTQIGEKIGKHWTTISKEILNHRFKKESIQYNSYFANCIYSDTCENNGYKGCNKLCKNFVEKECPILKTSPYVCNGCNKKAHCRFSKYYYRAKDANREYEIFKSESRIGVRISQEEIYEINAIITPLIKEQNQSINHVFIHHPDLLYFSKPTFYSYVNNNLFSFRNIDLIRKVKYKPRKDDEKRRTMLANFETLKQLDVLSGYVDTDDGTDNPITYILDVIHTSSVHDALENATLNIDVMGEFYNEFITHGQDLGNAKNGFVLTPRHICSLFADLAQLDENTRVLDMCFGTGGFLVAAMQKEMLSAKGDIQKINSIKNNNICGVELDGDRFTYGCVNMILRGDGQSNMLRGDCFNKEIIEYMKSKKCMAGFINPPYALPTLELSFVENMLDCLDVGGTGIAIIPASCATNKNSAYAAVRERILRKHTLEAVLSMPDQLFYPAAGVVTCVMVFTAHKPHNSDRKTWFARCKDDGFVIDRKSKGRADINNKWDEIRKKWVDSYIDRDVIDGFSLKHAVTAKDEWSYEAYAKTNFEGITEESFKKVIKEYALFLLSQAEV